MEGKTPPESASSSPLSPSPQRGDNDVPTTTTTIEATTAINEDKKDDQEKIDKAIKFWSHPLLQNVSSNEKRVYLRERGITDAILHKAWDRMLVVDGNGSRADIDTNDDNTPFVPSPHHRQQKHQQQYQQQQPFLSTSPPLLGTSMGMTPPPAGATTAAANMPNGYEEEESPMMISEVMHGASLLAVGSFLGLTAAATVRWLNGGDFDLFPSVISASSAPATAEDTSPSSKRMVLQHGSMTTPSTQQDGDHGGTAEEPYESVDYAETSDVYASEEGGEDDYNGYDNDDEQELREILLERIEAISTKIDANTILQQKVLSVSSSAIADHSMNLLRRSSNVNKDNEKDTSNLETSILLSHLTEIRSDIEKLYESLAPHTNGNTHQVQVDSAHILSNLNSCIEIVQSAGGNDIGDAPVTAQALMSNPTSRRDEPSSSVTVSPPSTLVDEVTVAPSLAAASNESTKNQMTLQDCIRRISENDVVTMRVGCQLLYLYLVNLAGNPDRKRYRKIYTSNESFQKVGNLVAGRELLRAVGFQEDEDGGALEWLPSATPEKEVKALAKVKEASAALSVLKTGKPSNELTARALTKLTPEHDGHFLGLAQPPPPPVTDDDVAPQTPVGSSLVSPPLPKKLPFVPPSGSPINLASKMEDSQD